VAYPDGVTKETRELAVTPWNPSRQTDGLESFCADYLLFFSFSDRTLSQPVVNVKPCRDVDASLDGDVFVGFVVVYDVLLMFDVSYVGVAFLDVVFIAGSSLRW